MLKKITISTLLLLTSIININAQILRQDAEFGKSIKDYEIETQSEDYTRQVNERFVLTTIKNLYDAEARFTYSFGSGEFATLPWLYNAGLIDEILASGEKYGYIFSVIRRPGNVGIPPGFYITARPRHYLRTGKQSFFMDASCLIRGGDKGGLDANANDPIVESCSPYLSYQWEYDIWQGIGQIRLAQEDYRNRFGNGSYGTLNDLENAGLVNYQLTHNWRTWLTMQIFPPNGKTPPSYKIFAYPQIYRETGIRSFYTDESGVLRGGDIRGQVNENSPIISLENEELAKFVMRSLWTAQARYEGLIIQGYNTFATEFWQLTNSRMLTFDMENGQFGDYQFEMLVFNRQFPKRSDFIIKATPMNYGGKTVRSFYISRFQPLRGADKNGLPADVSDPFVEF